MEDNCSSSSTSTSSSRSTGSSPDMFAGPVLEGESMAGEGIGSVVTPFPGKANELSTSRINRLERARKVKRRLFVQGDDSQSSDTSVHEEYKRLTEKEIKEKSEKYNFNFVEEKPMEGNYSWEEARDPPNFYKEKEVKSNKKRRRGSDGSAGPSSEVSRVIISTSSGSSQGNPSLVKNLPSGAKEQPVLLVPPPSKRLCTPSTSFKPIEGASGSGSSNINPSSTPIEPPPPPPSAKPSNTKDDDDDDYEFKLIKPRPRVSPPAANISLPSSSFYPVASQSSSLIKRIDETLKKESPSGASNSESDKDSHKSSDSESSTNSSRPSLPSTTSCDSRRVGTATSPGITLPPVPETGSSPLQDPPIGSSSPASVLHKTSSSSQRASNSPLNVKYFR